MKMNIVQRYGFFFGSRIISSIKSKTRIQNRLQIASIQIVGKLVSANDYKRLLMDMVI